ncbi:DUF2914 domain-containing protein [Nonlabens marinus]|uniref:Membrane protein, putative n=1 Tax=Nonlabens marinus S1-08 TaxID=1454201 RepID=W8W0B7_9FLAO|nr:DUF2914 domain-containing protein [Nonlabens marinus]BAO56046.1 membrane protein, putative [Nonlabens marinus S1-08]
MKRTLVKVRNSKVARTFQANQKYAPLLFFVGGFILDSLTLGRIDRLYDLIALCTYMTLLTLSIYLYNIADDGKWKNSFLKRYEMYLPLAIQFFFGGLSSAFVIYFFRSVSLSKTVTFFIILLALFIANEFLKKRISNKYLQFSVYFFVNFTFFTFITPVFIKIMNTYVFIISGFVSLAFTMAFILFIYRTSYSTRLEIGIKKMISFIVVIYTTINLFYFFNLIPPVPLALDSGMVAHDVKVENNHYVVTYEANEWYIFWRKHHLEFAAVPGEKVFVFTSIFAPTDIKKSIFHRWKWHNDSTDTWEIVDDIGYQITGGRDAGYRGYTYKKNIKPGLWKVEVITEEELIIGVIDFEIIIGSSLDSTSLVEEKF